MFIFMWDRYISTSIQWLTFPFLTICVFYFARHSFHWKKFQEKSLPRFKSSQLLIFYTVVKSIKKRSDDLKNQALCTLLETVCGLCFIFEKERIFEFFVFLKPFVFFYDPETVEVVLRNSHIIDKAEVYKYLHPWLRSGLLTSNGKLWYSKRKLLSPSFHYKIMEDFIPVLNRQSNILISKLYKLSENSEIDAVPLLTSCSVDIICETALGVCLNAQNEKSLEYVTAMHEIIDIFILRVLRPWLYPDFIFYLTSSGIKYKSNLKVIDEFAIQVIKEKKEQIVKKSKLHGQNEPTAESCSPNGCKRKPFLDFLLELHFKDPTFTVEDIIAEVNTFMFAGYDTSSMCLSWTLYLLSLDENVQERLHEELDNIFGEDNCRNITRADLTEMKYLECCIKESLRLYSPVPFFGREVKENFKVLDYTVKQGSVCFIIPYVLHRNPKYFPEPEKFDPERFFPENTVTRHPFAYIPFSAGPRNCIGQKFAMLEQKTVLANILRNFTVKSVVPRDKMNISGNLVIRNTRPLKLSFTPRCKNKF